MSAEYKTTVRKSGYGVSETIIDATARDRWGRPLEQAALNSEVRKAIAEGSKRIIIEGVMGQRYIASAARVKDLYVAIKGTPGNDLGAFLDGPTIEVFGNAQDMTGNTMSSGRIVVHGNAWDVTGLSLRGGRIMVRGSSGFRVGIHMKEYGEDRPAIVIGGSTGDYLGEYMAGGNILVLGEGVPEGESPVGSFIGTGIHGGSIFVRGKVEKHQLGMGASISELSDEDKQLLEDLITDFENTFKTKVEREWDAFTKIKPLSSRPFTGRFDSTPIWN